MPLLTHPGIEAWLDLTETLAEAAATAVQGADRLLRRRRRRSFATRRPGPDTPMWNALVPALRAELATRGTKVRLARHLGIPKQRLQDYLKAGSRLPDAELTLRLLHWLVEKRAGRDSSL